MQCTRPLLDTPKPLLAYNARTLRREIIVHGRHHNVPNRDARLHPTADFSVHSRHPWTAPGCDAEVEGEERGRPGEVR